MDTQSLDNQSVLFFTNSEMSRASIFLAVAHEFLIRGFAVHIASFAPLRSAIPDLHRGTAAYTRNEATFHALPGPARAEITKNPDGHARFQLYDIGFLGALRMYKKLLPSMLVPWDGLSYMEIYHACGKVLQSVKPAAVVVDPLFPQAIDACRVTAAQRMVMLAPSTVKDHVVQPYLASLWRPILSSGYPYPVPFHLLLPNMYLAIRLGNAVRHCERLQKIERYREIHGVASPYPLPMFPESDHTQFILPTRPETDFPCHVPTYFTLCGPIVRPYAPLVEVDAELANWVRQRPTVLVNLGAHSVYSWNQRRECAEGFRKLLEQAPTVQILWKMERDNDQYCDADDTALECLRADMAAGRVRIHSWLPADPFCIMMSGHVCCFVHHGSANAYHEAIKAAVPQVVFPRWFDHFEYASRVEWLRIGVWGNKGSAPAIVASELARALMRIVVGKEALSFQERAAQLAGGLGHKEGRYHAYERIREVMMRM